MGLSDEEEVIDDGSGSRCAVAEEVRLRYKKRGHPAIAWVRQLQSAGDWWQDDNTAHHSGSLLKAGLGASAFVLLSFAPNGRLP